MAALDKGIARRVKQSVERFAATGAGNTKRLTDIHPPQYPLRVGGYRVRFHLDPATMQILRVLPRDQAYRRYPSSAARTGQRRAVNSKAAVPARRPPEGAVRVTGENHVRNLICLRRRGTRTRAAQSREAAEAEPRVKNPVTTGSIGRSTC